LYDLSAVFQGQAKRAVFARYGHEHPIDGSGVMRRQPSGIHLGGADRMIRSPWLASLEVLPIHEERTG